jgi:hypothetical protein
MWVPGGYRVSEFKPKTIGPDFETAAHSCVKLNPKRDSHGFIFLNN